MTPKVHIVVTDDGWVVPRLAQVLADGTGWTMGNEPDRSADVNYFFPYLNWSPMETLTAAWFTHRDTIRPQKQDRWDEVSQRVNLALTCAPMYLEHLPAGARVVPPPIDQQFKITPHEPGSNPVIGISGRPYHDGRKGEDLIEALVKSGLPVTWRSSGRGWAVKTEFFRWEDMHKFYQSLDVFLCTSRIEGIPMPPLEALACGIPIVIPKGVGMLDELPDLPGIHRFDSGNYDDLHRALRSALDSKQKVHRQSLRDAVQYYTAEAWCAAHMDAMETLAGAKPLPKIKKLKPWQGKSGVYYVAYGKPARECAETAMASWHKHMPDVPMALVSDLPLGVDIEHRFIEQPDRDLGGRIAKLMVYDLAPADWEYVLYLDADTEITSSDVRFFFDLLSDGWEFVICKDPAKYASTKNIKRPDNGEEVAETYAVMGTENALQWNGGVFAFRRCERVEIFFKAWLEEWQRFGKRDQAALLRAMFKNPLRVFTLGNQWNTVTRYHDASESAGVLHHPMTARRWNGIVNERLDDEKAFKRIVK